MVVFTCNHCGDSLQKPKVAKHYLQQRSCREMGISLTCVDCFKDFFENQYDEHTKCITEAERYGGKNFQAKASMNKGEKKQQEWMDVVKNVLESDTNLSREERQMLQTLSKHDNIPRKKTKFLNFIKNVGGFRVNMSVVESCWVKMEAAYKGRVKTKSPKDQVTNNKTEENQTVVNTSIVENENNENICRENDDSTKKDSKTIVDNDEKKKSKKKKSKKRALENNEEKEVANADEPSAKRKNQEKTDVNKVAIPKFKWKHNILKVIGTKEEVSLKKLKKKVYTKYMNHVGETVISKKCISRFDKKLSKITNLVVVDGKVKRTGC